VWQAILPAGGLQAAIPIREEFLGLLDAIPGLSLVQQANVWPTAHTVNTGEVGETKGDEYWAFRASRTVSLPSPASGSAHENGGLKGRLQARLPATRNKRIIPGR
jgi:hypothetical protein